MTSLTHVTYTHVRYKVAFLKTSILLQSIKNQAAFETYHLSKNTKTDIPYVDLVGKGGKNMETYSYHAVDVSKLLSEGP